MSARYGVTKIAFYLNLKLACDLIINKLVANYSIANFYGVLAVNMLFYFTFFLTQFNKEALKSWFASVSRYARA